MQPVGFFDPKDPQSGTNANLPGFVGIPRIPGESLEQYQARLMKAQLPYQQANAERKQIEDLANTEETKSRKILDEQTSIQKQRLNDLAALLAEQQNRQFNRDIPGIANTAQGKGFLETSGFGDQLADRYTELQEDTTTQLARQGLTDRDLAVKTIGDIGTNNNNLMTGGLQRQFSVTDNARAEELARELGRMGVSAPAKGPSKTDELINAAGPIMSGVGALKAAGV